MSGFRVQGSVGARSLQRTRRHAIDGGQHDCYHVVYLVPIREAVLVSLQRFL